MTETTLNTGNMPSVQPAIVIVGAGAAGIAAASRLIANGFSNLKILEAENRIGGRLYSVPFGNTLVDLGAQWIHGEQGNVVYEMVKDLDCTGHPKSCNYQNLTFFTSDNGKINQNLANSIYEIAQGILSDETSASEYSGLLGTYFTERFNDKITLEFGTDNKEVLKIAKMIEEWASKFSLCVDPAESWYHITSRGAAAFQRCDGDQLIHWKNNGYSSILDLIMVKTTNLTKPEFLKNHVLLNKEVDKIIWSQTTDDLKNVKLHCTDGSTYLADHVILTVSVGVLKSIHDKLFEPSLPEYKINCVQHIPLGMCHKILLKFPKKWWPDDVKDFSFLWTDADKKSLVKDFPFGPTRNGRSWLEYLFGFYTVDSDPNILLGWLVGPMTTEVERLPDEIVKNASLFLLKKFVGNSYDIIQPEDILRSQWGTNPHFLGTYSYIGSSMEEKGATNEDLAKPLVVAGKEVVLFAGEATHSKYFSTVHGAVETGFREAERVTSIYRKPKYKVVIIGAGMAGLGAASKLTENGIDDFIILEAQNQAGGRIRTILVDNKPLDIGAQWMHGKSNPLYKMAAANGLLSDEISEEGLGQYVRSNGDIVEPYVVDKVAFKIGQILEDCEKFKESDNYPPSLRAFLDERFSQYVNEQAQNKEEIDIMEELFDWHLRFQVVDNSCTDLSRLSAKGWGDYVCMDDESHSNFKYGYQSLVQLILNSLPNDCVKYNCEVTKISFTKDKAIEVAVKDARSVLCDHLILTPSLGVLKQFSALSDVLPEDLLKNIEQMGFAAICKIYMFYEERWWGDTKGFQLLWTKSCKFSEKHSWMRNITGFDEVFNHKTALMTWVGGEAVREAESLHSDDTGKQCTELLQKFLVNYSVPEPNKVIRSKWLSNQFVRGSYCHITPECDFPNSGIRSLGKPVIVDSVPRIVLAGEAIHPSHYSTTHGAYESGLDQAQVICDYISSLI